MLDRFELKKTLAGFFLLLHCLCPQVKVTASAVNLDLQARRGQIMFFVRQLAASSRESRLKLALQYCDQPKEPANVMLAKLIDSASSMLQVEPELHDNVEHWLKHDPEAVVLAILMQSITPGGRLAQRVAMPKLPAGEGFVRSTMQKWPYVVGFLGLAVAVRSAAFFYDMGWRNGQQRQEQSC